MEDIPTVTQISVSIVQDAFGQDSLLADEGNPDSGREAAVRHPVHQLDDEVFYLVVGNDDLRLRGKTLEDGGHDGRFNRTPGSSRIGVISPGSANIVEEV